MHRDRGRPSEEGFTLLELMVVVLIIRVLVAIAIPTFRQAQAKAQDCWEPSITVYVKVTATVPPAVPNPVCISAKSSSGTCWYVRQNPTLGTVDFGSSTTCAAAAGVPYAARW